jgi:predicted phage terminase large subunit-like protein
MRVTASIIEGFVGSCLSNSFQNKVVSPSVHKEWWELCCGSDKYVAIAAPRGHAKSTAITLAYVLACVLFRERSYVIIISDTEGQATLFLNDIKRELIENEDIIKLFGVEKIEKDQETDIIVRMSDKHRFRIMAKGSEQRVRGLKWRGQRPDLIIGDDLENDEIVMNPERREKFRRWMNGAVLPILGRDGVIRIVGTILHIDSYLENRMPRLQSKATVHEELKVWSKNKIGAWRSVKYRAHNEDFSEILWPEMFSEAWLKEKRADLIMQGQADIYNQEYLNYPIDESRAYFRRGDMLPISDQMLHSILEEQVPLHYYIGVDGAFSTKTKRDYTCFVVVAVDSANMMFVVEVVHGRFDTAESVDLFFELQEKYDPEWFAIEKGIFIKSIKPFIDEQMLSRGIYPNVLTIAASVDKVERARSIIGRVRVHGVRFFKDAEWYANFEKELCEFDRGQHDDQVDAFGLIGLSLSQIMNAPTVEEQEETEFEEEKERSGFHIDYDGRSKLTGY